MPVVKCTKTVKKKRNIFEKTAAVSDIVSVESKKIKKLYSRIYKTEYQSCTEWLYQ